MKQKIIILTLLIAVILIGKSEAAILTQKLGSEYIETTVEENEAVTMTFISKKGFRFKNWVLIEGNIEINTTSEEINFDMPSTDVTIEAEYDTAYEITFNSNDGTGTTTSMTIIAESTEKLIANPFTREGYRFIGWSKEANGEVTYEDEEECTPTENLVLYAIWEVNEVTVKFESNGGSTVSDITVIYGSTYGELPAPSKTGYTFKGWYKEAGFTNQVTSDAQVEETTTHTLYAQWTGNTYTVKYNSNGGSGSMSSSTFTYGTAQKLATNTFTRANCTFKGWATFANATSITYSNNQSVNNLATSGTVTLYAIWETTLQYVPGGQRVILFATTGTGTDYYWMCNAAGETVRYAYQTGASSFQSSPFTSTYEKAGRYGTVVLNQCACTFEYGTDKDNDHVYAKGSAYFVKHTGGENLGQLPSTVNTTPRVYYKYNAVIKITDNLSTRKVRGAVYWVEI